MGSRNWLVVVVVACLGFAGLPVSSAFAGRLIATGHDADLHCTGSGTQCHYVQVAVDYVRGGAPDPAKPVLVLDHGGEVAGALDAAFGPGAVPRVVIDPRSPAFASAPIDVASYSALIVASDATCGGCDNNDSSATPDSDAINARAGDIASFFNAGGGIVALAGAQHADGIPGDGADVYYNFVPLGLTGQSVSEPFTLTPDGQALGFTDADVNCCPTHNSFAEPPAGGALKVAERDSTGAPETLFAEGSISGGGFVGGPGATPSISVSIADAAVTEGNSGNTTADFVLTLSAPAPASGAAVRYILSDDTAIAPQDYIVRNGYVVFEAGETSKVLSVPVVGDTLDEPDETFTVDLDSAQDVAISDGHAVGTIVNDDPPGSGTQPAGPAAPFATLRFDQSESPTPAVVGERLAYALRVADLGPGTVTGISVADLLPENVDFVSAGPSGACQVAGRVVTCTRASLTPDESAVFQIVVVPRGSGVLHNSAVLSADQLPSGDASSASEVTALPAPVAGKSVVLRVIRDPVYIEYPAGGGPVSSARAAQIQRGPAKGFVRLKDAASVPIGSTVDTEEGRIEMVSAANLTGRTQRAQFYSGVFRVRQRRTTQPVTDLVVKSSSFARNCPGPAPSSGRAAATKGAKRLGKVWGSGRGRFRTRGRFSAATVRGTIWLTEETCAGTRTVVKRGRVAVFDFVRGRRVFATPGHSYLARATRATLRARTRR